MPDNLAVETIGLSKTYRLGFWLQQRVRALDGLDLRIVPGQVFGLLGPNGAGKSTTIKILMNLVQPTIGEARIFGKSVEGRASRLEVGFVPENPAPYEHLTGREFVSLAGHLAGVARSELRARVDEVLNHVEMARTASLQIRRYSKGMIQRIALAQALVGRPKLLILDEPTSGLDPLGRRQMRDLILEQRSRGTTVLFCTHIIPDAESLCDRLAVLVNGKRVREGSVQELLTGHSPVIEVIIEGLSTEQIEQLQVPLQGSQRLEGRTLVRVGNAESQQLLQKVLAAGGRVTQMQSAKFSLEELFMSALKDAAYTGSVGGVIE